MPDLPSINPASLDSVSNAVKSVGSATGLTSIVNSVTGFTTGMKTILKNLGGIKLPLKNQLFDYASYDYIIGLGCLSAKEINDPDGTYIKRNTTKLICKSANTDPGNRVKTPYGSFDFFIDNLQLKSLIGFEAGLNTNVATLSFTVTEPYSMGMFYIACQTLATQLGHENWREAPFLLTIEFRGNKETGAMDLISGTRRCIPFTFASMDMTADQSGAKYNIKGIVWGQQALMDSVKKVKTDVQGIGGTVQEILQTGERSVQVSMNNYYKQQAKEKKIDVPDQVLIYFPTDPTSDTSGNAAGNTETNTPVALGNISLNSSSTVFEKLGVSRSDINGTFVQDAGAANAVGIASMKFDESKKADAAISKDNTVYDTKSGNFLQYKNKGDSTRTVVSYGSETDITMIINTVILQSSYADDALQSANIDSRGMKDMWAIQTGYYFISDEIQPATGRKAMLYVYKVVPYKAHTSNLMPAGRKAPGYSALSGDCAKVYDYLYTGKNVDVLDFKLKFNNSFTAFMPSALPSQSIDTKGAASMGGTEQPQANVDPLPEGKKPDSTPGVMTSMVSFIKKLTGTDLQGGGGLETQQTRAAKSFFDAITKGTELQVLRMKIIGDPYWIAQSGMGNYTSQPSQYSNLNSDGSVNYQNGEVDCRVNFRMPIDINQTTGLYDFGGSSTSAPVIHYSGLYQIILVNSTFSNGVFTQELKGLRRPLQESKQPEATPQETYNADKQKPDKTDQYNWE
jgi:hypothetical protein